MSDKFNNSEFFDENFLKPLKENAREALEQVNLLTQGLKAAAAAAGVKLAGITPDSLENLKKINTALHEVEVSDRGLYEAMKLRESLTARLSDLESHQAVEIQKVKEQIKEKAKANRELAREQLGLNTLYQKASKILNEHRNAYKNLELAGRAQGKVGRALLQTIQEQDAKLKALDGRVGQFQRSVGNYGMVADKFGAAFTKIGASIAGLFSVDRVIAFGKESIHAFVEAEKNANQLKFALRQVSGEGVIAFNELIKQSEELQDKGIFSDDAIQQAQHQLINYGMTSDQVQKLIPQIADLAAATGKDLGEATDIVIKGISGQTKGLKKLGIDYKDTGDKSENLGILTDKLTKFMGANAAQLETTAGKTARLENAWDNFSESVGEFLVNRGTDFLNFFDVLSGKISIAQAGINTLASAMYDAFKGDIDKRLANLTGTPEEKMAEVDRLIGVANALARAKGTEWNQGKISAENYAATITALTKTIKDLEQVKKDLATKPIAVLGGGDDEDEADKAKKAIDEAKKNLDAINASNDKLMLANANRAKDQLKRRAEEDKKAANETITDAIDRSQERIRIETDLQDNLAALDKSILAHQAKREIESIKATELTAKTKAKLIENVELSLIADMEDVDRQASQDKADNQDAEFKKMMEETDEENARIIKGMEDQAEKEKKLAEKKYSDIQRIRILKAGNNETQLRKATAENEQEDYERDLALLNASHDAGIKSEEDYLRELELLNLEHEKNLQDIKSESIDKLIGMEQELQDAIADGLDRRFDQRQAALDREGDMIDSRLSTQAELFARGLQNTLAFEEREKAKNIEKMAALDEKRRKAEEAQQLASVFFEFAKAYAKDGTIDAAGKALAQTLIVKGVGDLIAGSAYDGTADTGPGAKGWDNKGGQPWLIHRREAIIPAERNLENPGLASAWIQGDLDNYFRDIYLPQWGASLGTEDGPAALPSSNQQLMGLLNNRLASLERTVKNKKESSADWDSLGNLIVTEVENGIRRQRIKKKF